MKISIPSKVNVFVVNSTYLMKGQIRRNLWKYYYNSDRGHEENHVAENFIKSPIHSNANVSAIVRTYAHITNADFEYF